MPVAVEEARVEDAEPLAPRLVKLGAVEAKLARVADGVPDKLLDAAALLCQVLARLGAQQQPLQRRPRHARKAAVELVRHPLPDRPSARPEPLAHHVLRQASRVILAARLLVRRLEDGDRGQRHAVRALADQVDAARPVLGEGGTLARVGHDPPHRLHHLVRVEADGARRRRRRSRHILLLAAQAMWRGRRLAASDVWRGRRQLQRRLYCFDEPHYRPDILFL
mmetsp:Transcript_32971/g.105767  ORF Transcript_32971/g.105767 Transcript_32971/m.105767 type:complete len:223 (-) Transcript_32971:324-992(-)